MPPRAKLFWSAPLSIMSPASAPSVHTTPESRDLFELMAEGVARGATELVTEVSSHASIRAAPPESTSTWCLHQPDPRPPRLHQTLEKYFAAKRLLFDGTVYPAPRIA